MPDFLRTSSFQILSKNLDLIFVIAVIGVITIIFIPLPNFLIDLLLITNITITLLILLTSIYVKEPINFSVFPTILLLTTAFRLSLNIATTRLILTNAATLKEEAAGKVIKAFGTFVAGNQPLIGFIIFIIIFVIQFVVITKGATRISEVAARFVLDALPGKQMSIDAELNAGIITPEESKVMRARIAREADFYGAMDGAAKFVRGDAIAGVVISLVNILGGFLLGYLKYGFSLAESLVIFTKLTIGDGLVSQVPALIVSLSAGLIITRVSSEADLGKDIVSQVFSVPKALAATSVFLLFLVITPLPKIQLLIASLSLASILVIMSQASKRKKIEETAKKAQVKREPERVEGLLKIDPIELEIGYNLIPLVEPEQGGDLLERITLLRRQIAVDLGLVVPPIRIRDNLQLEPEQYSIKVRGIKEGEGSIMMGHFLALESALVKEKIEGVETVEPVFKTKAYWITADKKRQAEANNYTVVEPSAVIATHLSEVIKRNAPIILTKDSVNNLINNLKETSPNLVEEVNKVMKVGEVQKILQNLLKENVSIRDLETILEALTDYAPKIKEPELLTEYVRIALGKSICQRLLEKDGKLYCIALDTELEELVKEKIDFTEKGLIIKLPPNLMNSVIEAIMNSLEKLVKNGHLPVVLTSPEIRLAIRRILERTQPSINVISYTEVPRDIRLEIVATAEISSANPSKNSSKPEKALV